jgi:hypothetical protein
MAFKIKDLMISVLAAKAAGQIEICDDSCPELSCDFGTNGSHLGIRLAVAQAIPKIAPSINY